MKFGTRTVKGRVVYDRPIHYMTFRRLDKIMAGLLRGVALPDPAKILNPETNRWTFPHEFNKYHIDYLKNIVRNIESYIGLIEGPTGQRSFLDFIWEIFIGILRLFLPEAIIVTLRMLYSLTPQEPGESLSEEDWNSVKSTLSDLFVLDISSVGGPENGQNNS